MKVKLLKRVRRHFLIKHTDKGTAICNKDFTQAVLIDNDGYTWRRALTVRYMLSDRFLEERDKNKQIRFNKRIFLTPPNQGV